VNHQLFERNRRIPQLNCENFFILFYVLVLSYVLVFSFLNENSFFYWGEEKKYNCGEKIKKKSSNNPGWERYACPFEYHNK